MNIAKIEKDFLTAKREIRELVYTSTPENKKELDKLLKEIDNLIEIASKKKMEQDGIII